MIRLGTAGSLGLGYDEAFRILQEKGLHAMEIEFTYGVRMAPAEAQMIGELAKKYGISLSVHAPYYINLASKEPEKIVASKVRILESAKRAHLLGAGYVVFHCGFYQKMDKGDVYRMIRDEVIELTQEIERLGLKARLAPETTGKRSQFGDLDELLRLKQETGCHLTVDFSHILAREGSIDYDEVLCKLKDVGHIHAHFSGIEYTPAGEKRHIRTQKEFALPFIKSLKRHSADITVINESPYPLEDSLLCKSMVDE